MQLYTEDSSFLRTFLFITVESVLTCDYFTCKGQWLQESGSSLFLFLLLAGQMLILEVLQKLMFSSDNRFLDNGSRNFSVTEIDLELPENPIRAFKEVKRNGQLCTLCENFTAQATKYLSKNETQTEIIETLHQACSEWKPFEEQCLLLVDYYSALFFAEISKIHPEDFCRKFTLCEQMFSVSLLKSENSCSVCHDIMDKVLVKLKDPDTQFDVIKMLLKECNQVEQYVQQCKRLVLQYGPLILVNGEKFLEDTDVCVAIRACKADKAELVNDAAVSEEQSLVVSM